MTYARGQKQRTRSGRASGGRCDGSGGPELGVRRLASGLLEARHDAASGRFDVQAAAAEADGRIDERTARVLRWWQRESVRAVVEHARSVIPPALGALDEADEEASRQNDDAAQAWERATARPLPQLGLPQLGLQVLTLPGALAGLRRAG